MKNSKRSIFKWVVRYGFDFTSLAKYDGVFYGLTIFKYPDQQGQAMFFQQGRQVSHVDFAELSESRTHRDIWDILDDETNRGVLVELRLMARWDVIGALKELEPF